MTEIALIEKMKLVEKFFGGGAKAAEAAGVTHTSWSRWKAGKPEPIGMSLRTIELLYEKQPAPTITRLEQSMGKTDKIKTFKVDDDFDAWLTEQRNHPNLTELGLSELIRLSLKIAVPMLQAPPCFAETLCEFHRKAQS